MDAKEAHDYWLQKLGRKALVSSSFASQEHSYRSGLDEETAASGAAPLPRREPCHSKGLLGSGGMGDVFRARQPELERDVAIKKLRCERSGPLARNTFLAEAVVTGQLEHPNIVPVYSLAVDPDDEIFLAMKLVDGATWKTLIRETRPGELSYHLEILLQVCNAVAYAHSRHIIHNDLKPDNVMVGAFGEVTLLDWGLAVSNREAPDRFSRVRHQSVVQNPVGTPAYMPPELALGQGAQLGAWTDTYLLGAVLFELLSGHPPHRMPTLGEALDHAARGVVPELPEELPQELRKICQRALAPKPAERYQTVQQLQTELRAYLQHRESLTLSERATSNLQACAVERSDRTRLYDDFAACIGGFIQARTLWEANPQARDGEQRARLRFGAAALRHGDLALASTQLELARELELEAASPELTALDEAIAARRQAELDARTHRRRLRLAVRITTAALLCALLAGLIGSIWANRTIEDRNRALERERALVTAQRDTIAREKANAEKRGGIAEQALEKLAGDVQHKLSSELGSERAQRVARSLLRFSLEGWQQLRDADLASQRSTRGSARVRLELAKLLGTVYGELDAAAAELRAAESTLVQLLPVDPDGAGRDLLLCRDALAWILAQQGETDTARALLEDCLGSAEELAARRPANLGVLLKLRTTLAMCLSFLGDYAHASELLEANVAAHRDFVPVAELPALPGNLATDLDMLANCQRALGQIEAAQHSLERALLVGEAERQLDPDNWLRHDGLATTGEQLAEMAANIGDSERAQALLAPALEHWRGRSRLDPENSYVTRKLLNALIISAKIFSVSPDPARALVPIEEAIVLADGLVSRPLPPVPLLELRWDAYLVRADALNNCDRYHEARRSYLEALAMLPGRLLQPERKRARLLVELGSNAALCGLNEESMQLLLDGLALLEGLERDEDLERCRADAYTGLARHSLSEAGPLLEQALQSYERCLDIDSANVLTLSRWAPVALGVAEHEMLAGAPEIASARFLDVFVRLGNSRLAAGARDLRVNAAQHHLDLQARAEQFPADDRLWSSALACARELAKDPAGPDWALRALFNLLGPMAQLREHRQEWPRAVELLRERLRVAQTLAELSASEAALVWWGRDALIRLLCLTGDLAEALSLCSENRQTGTSPSWDLQSYALVMALAGDREACVAELRDAAADSPAIAAWLAAFSGETSLLRKTDPELARLLRGELEPTALFAEQPADEHAASWLREAHVLLGIACERQGAPEAARRHYERCRALGSPWELEMPMRWALARLRQRDLE